MALGCKVTGGILRLTDIISILDLQALSHQSCPALFDAMDCSPPGPSVLGILQAILEWVAISFSNA